MNNEHESQEESQYIMPKLRITKQSVKPLRHQKRSYGKG